MNPGRGTFEDVLDRVRHERADDPSPGSAFWTRTSGLNASFVGMNSKAEHRQDNEQLHAAYYDYVSAVVAPPPPPKRSVPPPKPALDVSMFKRLSPEEIAKDLNLLASDTRAELQKKRRKFARTNHPDRAPEQWRTAATTRMMLANHLVDAALRKTRSQRR